MAVDVSAFQNAVENFNDTYQTNFNLQDFIRKSSVIFGSQKSAFNANYKRTIQEMAAQVLTYKEGTRDQLEAKTIPTLFDMLEDFENNIIAPYREACKEQNSNAFPEPYAGWTKQEQVDIIKDALKTVPKNLGEVQGERYKSGHIRIRDMVAVANSISEVSMEKSQKVAEYVIALEAVNANRSRAWRFFHPFRNRAEKREAAAMRQTLQNTVGEYLYNQYFERATRTFSFMTSEVDQLDLEMQSEARRVAEEEQNRVEEARVKQELTEHFKKEHKKEVEMLKIEKLLLIGYKPNPKTINEDIQIANQIIRAEKAGALDDDPTYEVFKINYKRIVEVKNMVKQNGINGEVMDSLSSKYEEWDKVDTANKNGELRNYRPDCVEKIYNKEVLKIDLNEPKVEEEGLLIDDYEPSVKKEPLINSK